jgi:2-polyprenyl-6-methoxyphenol hydroxylase-like FAD-dependent oxidoreductase
MNSKSVLISGASLAGPTLAYWLARTGFDVTVVERAAEPRPGGTPIDVRGKAVDVADHMGILPRILDAKTSTEGVEFVDATGKRVATLDPSAYAEQPGRDIELERTDLVNIIYDATKNDVEYAFEDSVESLTQDGGGVDVTFARGADRRFDLVVGADGLHSMVRRLAFGEESRFVHHLGMYVAIASVDPQLGRKDWAVMHNSPGKVAGIHRYHDDACAFFMFRSPTLSYDYHDLDQQKKLLIEAFAGETWLVPKLLDTVRASDSLYFDSVSQVRMAPWSQNRVTLVGDAGYCPALLSGMGTTLAMVGACVLAGELRSATGDHRTAFARYEHLHRPLVQKAQKGVMLGAGLLVPATRSAMWRRNQLTRLLPLLLATRRLTRRSTTE